ncbi:unnamed protein product [Caenorhabditis brenneri]
MKLFHLPYLCQREIFKEMHFSTRYTFTLGTRRMKIWAKRLQNSLKSPELQVEIGHTANGLIFEAESGERSERIMHLAKIWYNPDEKKVMKFGDLELECGLTFSPILSLRYDNCLPPTTRILESLCDFFNTTKEDVVYILNSHIILGLLPPIPIRKSVLRLTSWCHNMEKIDRFYSMYPLQHFSMVQSETDVLQGIWSDFRVILQTRNLFLSSLGRIFSDVLVDFQGENAVFRGVRIQNHSINEFLRDWMGRYSDDLKTIIVEVTEPLTQVELVFEGITFTKEKQGGRYPYSSLIQDYYDFPKDAFDCSNTYSIVRNAGTYREQESKVVILENGFLLEENTTILEIGGMEIPCEVSWCSYGVVYIKHDPEIQPSKEIIDYLCDLFNIPSENVMEIQRNL